jgi:hypothetical protein
MIIYNIAGIYYATMKNQNGSGGYIARGRSHFEALTECLRLAGLI